MAKRINLTENKPYPNNELPVLYYENILKEVLDESFTAHDVLQLFENNGYTNGWVNGILARHHFHSTAHEVLACTKGEVKVQLGGENGEMTTLREGDVILLPAGTSHKKLDATENFEIVGAYPVNDSEYDFQYGDAISYEAIKKRIKEVKLPDTDPVTGSPGEVQKYWLA